MTSLPVDPSRRRFVRTVAGTTIAAALPLAGCGHFAAAIPDSANAAWTPEPASADPRVRALSWAILAPNPHNRQPWLMELSGDDEIVVRIDTERLLPETDPFGRQIVIGTGAMLGLLDIAAANAGFTTETRYFEDGEFGRIIDARLVARVRFVPGAGNGADAELFPLIPVRRTVKSAYDPARAPDAAFARDLATLSRADGIATEIVTHEASPERAAEVAALVRRAWEIELRDPAAFMESMRLLRVGAKEIDRHRDGISITSPFLVTVDRLGLFDRSEPPPPDSSILTGQIEDFDLEIASTPAYFAMTSRGNGRVDQLEVGKAYVRAQLHATARGLVMHPLSQALQEYAAMAQAYADAQALLGGPGETVQMICRLGYLPEDESLPPASPRRGLDAHLVT